MRDRRCCAHSIEFYHTVLITPYAKKSWVGSFKRERIGGGEERREGINIENCKTLSKKFNEETKMYKDPKKTTDIGEKFEHKNR